MFIECHDGSYFNTDKAVEYTIMKTCNGDYNVIAWAGANEDNFFALASYGTEERVRKECRNIVEWIRSVQGLEPSNPAFLSKFIYSMPKE